MTTTFTYDSTGNLLTKAATDTTTTAVPYSTNGTSRTWTYTWSNSLLASVKKPRTDVSAVTQFTYDSSGALTATTNALGQVTRITQHLPGGLPQTLVDPNGVTTQLTYDARQRLLTRTVGTVTTTYNYDKAGNLIGVIPAGRLRPHPRLRRRASPDGSDRPVRPEHRLYARRARRPDTNQHAGRQRPAATAPSNRLRCARQGALGCQRYRPDNRLFP